MEPLMGSPADNISPALSKLTAGGIQSVPDYATGIGLLKAGNWFPLNSTSRNFTRCQFCFVSFHCDKSEPTEYNSVWSPES